MELNELHRRAVEGWRTRCAAVEPAQWDDATPCTDWDVRTLVNHVVGEELWTVPLVDGATIAEVGDRFDGDVLGENPDEVAARAASEAVAAVDERLPRGEIVHVSFGDVPVEEYVWQLTADHLIHSWDLAAGTGQSRQLDADVVAGVASWFADREAMYRDAGAIGPRLEAPDDPQSQLLAAFGRDSSW